MKFDIEDTLEFNPVIAYINNRGVTIVGYNFRKKKFLGVYLDTLDNFYVAKLYSIEETRSSGFGGVKLGFYRLMGMFL